MPSFIIPFSGPKTPLLGAGSARDTIRNRRPLQDPSWCAISEIAAKFPWVMYWELQTPAGTKLDDYDNPFHDPDCAVGPIALHTNAAQTSPTTAGSPSKAPPLTKSWLIKRSTNLPRMRKSPTGTAWTQTKPTANLRSTTDALYPN